MAAILFDTCITFTGIYNFYKHAKENIYVTHNLNCIRNIDGKQIFDGRILKNVFSAFGKRI